MRPYNKVENDLCAIPEDLRGRIATTKVPVDAKSATAGCDERRRRVDHPGILPVIGSKRGCCQSDGLKVSEHFKCRGQPPLANKPAEVVRTQGESIKVTGPLTLRLLTPCDWL